MTFKTLWLLADHPVYEIFLGTGIPLHKANNVCLKNCFTKYTGWKIPGESTLRKNSVPKVYDKALNKIREKIGSHNIWVSIDEIPVVNLRPFLNGKLTRNTES